MEHIDKINISDRKIVFLGYGGVAKCTLNYFQFYFQFKPENVYIIDKCQASFYGPFLNKIPKKNKLVQDVDHINFEEVVEQIGMEKNDILIDLTFSSSTYYFVKRCLEYGFNYINTSIEDSNDKFMGTSIDHQEKVIDEIFDDFKKHHKVSSNLLIESGQNPGLIQHYILYALNHLNKQKHQTQKDDYRKEAYIKAIKEHKIGSILMSEIDNMLKKKDLSKTKTATKTKTRKVKSSTKNTQNKIFNTWSVSGLLNESLDKAEIVAGGSLNSFIKPVIPESDIDENKTSLLSKTDYHVKFLKECGMNVFLNSICPVLDKKGEIKYQNFEGNLIHHGEIFELGHLFGKYAPFMSYVYKINRYADESIRTYFKNNPFDSDVDLIIWIQNHCNSFHVYDNINKSSQEKLVGHDTMGCTFYCGDQKSGIDKIYWCGSILDTKDQAVMSDFTPTTVQVAAGVLSGLSYILEPKNANKGVVKPTDTYTPYILEKAIPLLGKVFFVEIPRHLFKKSIEFHTEKIIK